MHNESKCNWNCNNIPKDYRGLKFLKRIQKDPLNEFVKIMYETGPWVWFKILNKPVLLLNDATAIKHVFQDNFEGYKKGDFNEVLRPLLGNGIFLSEGDVWKDQRREGAPVFANKNFPEIVNQIKLAANSMFERWDQYAQQDKPIKLDIEMMWFALDVVLRALFHEERQDVAAQTKESLGVLLKDAEKRIWSVLCAPQSLVLKLPKYKRAQNFLNEFVEDMVEKRKESKIYPDDLLSRLIESYPEKTQDQAILRDQVMSFLLAGHETTANGLIWAWYEISRRPEIRDQLAAEVDKVLHGRSPVLEDIPNLKYTESIFEEAMRLYPPVWTMSRQALQDDEIPTDAGTTIHVPKGATVMLCAYTTHRSESYWEHPEAFNPSRFSAEEKQSRPKFAYFAFGGGSRLCLGHRFAMIESVIVMAMIAQRYELTLLSGQSIEPEPIITLRPDQSVLFKIKHRKDCVERCEESTSVATLYQCPHMQSASVA